MDLYIFRLWIKMLRMIITIPTKLLWYVFNIYICYKDQIKKCMINFRAIPHLYPYARQRALMLLVPFLVLKVMIQVYVPFVLAKWQKFAKCLLMRLLRPLWHACRMLLACVYEDKNLTIKLLKLLYSFVFW